MGPQLSYQDAFQVLLLQAADNGRGPVLFGESLGRAREAVPPYLLGTTFPSVYLEHPLAGTPFLDVTVLFSLVEPRTRIDSPAAGKHGAIMDWYAEARRRHEEISFGFELDTKEPTLPPAAVHFQPRGSVDLVRPFCEAAGVPERADLYLNQAARMPEAWQLSFFGMFRGRPASPLRVCGYLHAAERQACATYPAHLAATFDAIGFRAYDDAMIAQVTALMAAAPGAVDFQFDVFPDGSLSDTFAIDVDFGIKRSETVLQSFASGAGLRVMRLLEEMGAADERWRLSVQSVFARAVPLRLGESAVSYTAFTLMPQWVKARWIGGVLQTAKLYHLANASSLDKDEQQTDAKR